MSIMNSNNQSNTPTDFTYNKERTMTLYNQRKLEAEKIKGEIDYLKGNIGAQLNTVKKTLKELHPQLIDFYEIEVPTNLEDLNSEQLSEFVSKLVEVEQALGGPIQHYLETGDMSILSVLPKLEDLSVLQNYETGGSLPEEKEEDDSLDILRNT